MNKRLTALLALSLAIALPAIASPPPSFTASGDMTLNADGTASFEFRLANDHPDTAVTAFTVTVAFYDREVGADKKLAAYRWSFVSPVPPRSQLLEYGVLDASAVKDLRRRHKVAAGVYPLFTALYTYTAMVDAEVFTPKGGD